ncbi:MAG: C39 family peptidase [Oculatellaceae cyanobacterium Prado106]|jgi:hypothetical protein|nr:C39 family peptidase [Oculatellaceae cyanobacterium Prado106]
MKLTEFVGANLRYDTRAIALDPELSQEVQTLLVQFGLLAEPENPFGIRAIAALTRFQRQHGCDEPEFLGAQTAAKLLEVAEVGTRAPASIITVEAIQSTVLKLRPLNSKDLADSEKHNLPAGKKLDVTYFEPIRKHFVLTLTQEFQGSLVWYAFGDHIKISGGEELNQKEPSITDQKPVLSPDSPPSSFKLNVPYKSQRDNLNNPDGSCNVTAIAMCLAYLGVPQRRSNISFEDELYEYTLDHNLSRHSPYDLAQVVRDYGAKNLFDKHSTFDAVKKWIAGGNPAVTHGYFTTFGHIITLVGYDEKGFIVHDPYGEWYAEGYDRNKAGAMDTKGKFQHYSYGLIERTCCTDDQFWVHFISK